LVGRERKTHVFLTRCREDWGGSNGVIRIELDVKEFCVGGGVSVVMILRLATLRLTGFVIPNRIKLSVRRLVSNYHSQYKN